ncbi:hypothetical protein [Ruminococcus sp. FC2018]|uniref:hypothetical protein n=1 Tax=Ruminococcus sp. FC2018 TaxID=1410617 RepID=UPI00048FAD16|nr:hypothetical protein [Ruminococcus sp. FC2018]
MRKNKYTRRYLESKDFHAEASLYTGFAINLFFACSKGATGAAVASVGAYAVHMCPQDTRTLRAGDTVKPYSESYTTCIEEAKQTLTNRLTAHRLPSPVTL